MGGAWLWARADIVRRWPALVMLAVLIALPVGVGLALASGARRAGEAIDRFVDSTGLSAVVAFVGEEPSAELLDALAADERISSIERTTTAVIIPDPVPPGALGFGLIGMSDGSPGGLNRPMLLAGRYPVEGAVDEIMVNERAAEKFGFAPGMRVPLSGFVDFESFEPSPFGEATIVGVVRLVFDLVEDPASESFLIAGPDLLEGGWRDAAQVGTILWLHVPEDGDVAGVVSDLSPRIARGDLEATRPFLETADHAAALQFRGLLGAAGVVGLAGLFVTVQAAGRHLSPRTEDAGVLAAIGLPEPQRRWAAMLAVAPALTAGVVGGLGLAVAVSPLLPLGLARRADPAAGFNVDWAVLAAGLVIAGFLVGAGAALAARRWLRKSTDVHAADRPSVASRLAGALGLGPIPATGSQLALERGRRGSRLPVGATLAALVVAAAVVSGAIVVRSSLDGLAGDRERYGQAWDVRVGIQGENLRTAGERLAADSRVAAVMLTHSGEVNIVDAGGATVQVGAMGLEALSGTRPLAVLDGRAPSALDEVALGAATSERLGLGLGDTTRIGGPCGEREAEVVGRVILPMSNEDGDSNNGAILPLAAFDALCAGQLTAEIEENVGALVRVHDPADGDALVTEALDAGGFAESAAIVPGSVRALGDLRQIPLLVGGFVGLLALAAGGHALLLAVRRRRTDLAVLRALGLRPKDVRGIVAWQAGTLAVVALALGIPLGLVVGRVVWRGIAEPSNVLVRYDMAPLAVTAVAVVALAMMLALSVWPGRRAVRATPAEGLRSE